MHQITLAPNPGRGLCDLAGYNDANFFWRVFKRDCGATPREYRQRFAGRLQRD